MNTDAVYAIVRSSNGDRLCFRVGQPTTWEKAVRRWNRLDCRRGGFEGVRKRRVTIQWNRRVYKVEHFEIRSVDIHGRGIGGDRHASAIPAPYRNVKSAI